MKVSFRRLGPGIAVAATGVGAGDMVAATVAGSKFGMAVAWAVLVGAILKWVMNEGLARWQLATGTTLLEGWFQYFGKWVQTYFLVYLVVWSIVVGGALIAACGLATHALFPGVPVWVGGVGHTLVGIAVVWWGRYDTFEKGMKGGIALLFFALLGCSWSIEAPWVSLVHAARQAAIPPGSVELILGMIGGVGGSLTLLAYGYWIREKGWSGPTAMAWVRGDLGVAYGLTALFGLAVVVLASGVLGRAGITVAGSQGVVQMGQMLESSLGRVGGIAFAVGFWAAVATSLVGVWQSVPYLFADAVRLSRGEAEVSTQSRAYRGYLLYLGLVPTVLLFLDKPVFLILLYSVVGALFMPFLAFTLLWLLRKGGPAGTAHNSTGTSVALVLCLILFGYLCAQGVWGAFQKL